MSLSMTTDGWNTMAKIPIDAACIQAAFKKIGGASRDPLADVNGRTTPIDGFQVGHLNCVGPYDPTF
jgi:hypothetical protein